MKLQKENSSPSSPPNRRKKFTSYQDQILIPSADLSEIIRQSVAKNCIFRFSAKGWSMSPFIKDMDVVTIAPPYRHDINRGSIVALWSSGDESSPRLLIHRIIDLCGDQHFLIKGDNVNKHKDGVFSFNEILGKVIKIERNGQAVNFGLGIERYAIAFLSRHDVLIPCINLFRKGKSHVGYTGHKNKSA